MSLRMVARIVGVSVVVLLIGSWFFFHSLPWESELRQMILEAQAVEIVLLVDGIPRKKVRFEDPNRWQDLARSLRYEGTFWKNGQPPVAEETDPPIESVAVQLIRKRLADDSDSRPLLVFRDDGHLYLFKAFHWYRMPIDPEIEGRLRVLLEQEGEDLVLPENGL